MLPKWVDFSFANIDDGIYFHNQSAHFVAAFFGFQHFIMAWAEWFPEEDALPGNCGDWLTTITNHAFLTTPALWMTTSATQKGYSLLTPP